MWQRRLSEHVIGDVDGSSRCRGLESGWWGVASDWGARRSWRVVGATEWIG